jgi:ribosomal protein S18 acetylase RimI-like enzyme
MGTIAREEKCENLEFPFPGVQRCTISRVYPGLLKLIKLEIAPEYQGRRIGSRVLSELKRLGQTITLVAYPDDPSRYEDCRRFYRRNGFTEVEGDDGTFVWHP